MMVGFLPPSPHSLCVHPALLAALLARARACPNPQIYEKLREDVLGRDKDGKFALW